MKYRYYVRDPLKKVWFRTYFFARLYFRRRCKQLKNGVSVVLCNQWSIPLKVAYID